MATNLVYIGLVEMLRVCGTHESLVHIDRRECSNPLGGASGGSADDVGEAEDRHKLAELHHMVRVFGESNRLYRQRYLGLHACFPRQHNNRMVWCEKPPKFDMQRVAGVNTVIWQDLETRGPSSQPQ
jgi:hypothetical protein